MNIKIGVIVNTHGLKGELKVKSMSDFNEVRFAKGKTLLLSYHNEMIKVQVASYRENKGMVYISFKDHQDINLVEMYKGCDLYIRSEDRHELEEDEVYYSDLMDCMVYDEEGNQLGQVEDIVETGANAVLRVNQRILIPYVKDFIVDVDIEAKKIIVHVMEGLI